MMCLSHILVVVEKSDGGFGVRKCACRWLLLIMKDGDEGIRSLKILFRTRSSV
jgi:hypothetical protein